jgi:hypothetical protein
MVRQSVLKSCLVMVALLIPEGGRAIVFLSRLLMPADGLTGGVLGLWSLLKYATWPARSGESVGTLNACPRGQESAMSVAFDTAQ